MLRKASEHFPGDGLVIVLFAPKLNMAKALGQDQLKLYRISIQTLQPVQNNVRLELMLIEYMQYIFCK